jgi:hypothetical protein
MGADRMTLRAVLSGLCRAIAGIGSLLVSAYGAYMFNAADFRQDAVVMGLFCILPALFFPVFLVSFRSLRWSVALHWILAVGYLVDYSMLDWRTCSELGYCSGALGTVLVTLTARPVQGAFAVAASGLAGLLLRDMRRHTRSS